MVCFFSCEGQKFNKQNFCLKLNNFIKNCEQIEYPEGTVDSISLKDFINNLDLFMDVSINNIINGKTTRNGYGHSPYKRLCVYAKIQTFDIISIDDSIYEFDPSHPDAIKEGSQKGYVAYPNIDSRQEKNNLKILFQFYVYYSRKHNKKSAQKVIDVGSVEKEVNKYLDY